MDTRAWILMVGIILLAGCIGQESLQETQPSTAVKEITAKEAYDLAYERASSEYGDVYLRSMGSGGTVVGFKKGQAPVAGGRNDKWLVTFEKKESANTYRLVFATISEGKLLDRFGCYASNKTMEIDEASWEEHARKRLVDVSEWNIDSPEAVEIAKQETDEDLGTLSFTVDYYYHVAEKPVYNVMLGPLTGEGGKGLTVYIDMTDGTVLRTAESSWR